MGFLVAKFEFEKDAVFVKSAKEPRVRVLGLPFEVDRVGGLIAFLAVLSWGL